MTDDEIIEQIHLLQLNQTETPTIEAKTAGIDCPDKYYDTISSFANYRGGVIIFGIDQKRNFQVTGVYDVADLQSKVAALCCDTMVPAIRPEFHALTINSKRILAVRIQELPESQKPCYYKPKGLVKGSYIRVGDRDELMTDYELYSLSSYRQHIQEDRRIIERTELGDLNTETLDAYLAQMKEQKPQFAKKNRDARLRLSGIIEKDGNEYKPTLAGMLVFGTYPQWALPQIFVACMVIPGTKKGDTGISGERFIDNRRVEGSIEEMYDGTMVFLQKNMRTKIIIDPHTGKREDRPEYPLQALREAVANALVHRDYSQLAENVYVEVCMYSDRVEIHNPGDLYGVNRIENLGTDAIMETRNSTIVKLLEEKHAIIENRHSGVPTIRQEMSKYGLPEPKFIEERGGFRVVLYNDFSETTSQNNTTTSQKGETTSQNNTTTSQKGETTSQNNTTTSQFDKTRSQSPTLTSRRRPIAVSRKMVLEFCVEPRTTEEIRQYLGLKNKIHVSRAITAPLIKEGKLAYTNPRSPHARNQKYRAIGNTWGRQGV